MYDIKYQDEDFLLLVEWEDGLPFLHHHYYNWSLSVHKKAIKAFVALIEELKNQGHTELWSYYDKTNTHVDKFCNKYNFIKVGETETENIVLKEI
jgi:hypothetical protein